MDKLLVKNLPVEFSDEDKSDFLKLFGANEVICFPSSSKMRGCCFALFPDNVTAKQGLDTLHQFEVIGKRLVVEYAKTVHETFSNQISSKNIMSRNVFVSESIGEGKSDEKKALVTEELGLGICPKLNVNHNLPNHLTYKYPEPNVAILTNIANALASVPKFYTQVLHLMNKMNLPPPFSGSTLTPPLQGDSISLRDACVDTSDLKEVFSSDESEIESDSEHTKTHEIYKDNQVSLEPVTKRKRLRALAKTDQEKLNKIPKIKSNETVESTFEGASSSKRFEFKLALSIKEAVEKKQQPAVSYNVFDERGQFGKLQPARKESFSSSDDDTDHEGNVNPPDFITSTKLKSNRISESDILQMAQFKKYSRGEKTNRLYVKNLSKLAVEADLKFIFKRFLRHCSDEEKESLDIRLMQEGRMKGQAFITLPSEDIAEKALLQTHGYVLHDKPMVIQFGRAGNKQK